MSTLNFAIIYEGQRKVVKATNPNALLQTVLAEAASLFGQEISSCSLKHKNKALDCSQPIRFSNLPNNVQLELIINKSTRISGGGGSGSGTPTKIALSYTIGKEKNTGTITSTFPSTHTLYELLEDLVKTEKLPSFVLEEASLLELVYMRSAFTSLDSLRQNSLASLGLTG